MHLACAIVLMTGATIVMAADEMVLHSHSSDGCAKLRSAFAVVLMACAIKLTLHSVLLSVDAKLLTACTIVFKTCQTGVRACATVQLSPRKKKSQVMSWRC